MFEIHVDGSSNSTKTEGEAGGEARGDWRPEGHVFHTSRQAMIKTYCSTPIKQYMAIWCKTLCKWIEYLRNRWRNKIGCSQEAAAASSWIL